MSSADSITTQVVNWVHDVTLDDVPASIKDRVRYLILDGIACGLVAAHLPWSETAAKTMFEFEGNGACSIWGWDRKLGPLAAAIINSSFVQGFEIDDWHRGAPCHSGSIILPALFAAAEQSKASGVTTSGKDFLLATVVGFEMGPRTGLALYGVDLLARGFHPGTLMGHAGSAAACAKLLQLPPIQIEHSLGSACTQACGLQAAQYSSMMKRMQHGFAARNGLFAAMMSRGGYTGIEQVFDVKYGGFLSVFGAGSKHDPPYLPGELTKELGKTWEIKRILVKPYSAQAALHAMIDCLDELQKRIPERMSNFDCITNIHVEMSDIGFKHGGFECPPPPLAVTAAQMSAPYSVAVKLVDGDVFVAQFAASKINRPILWSLMAKVTMEHNTEFDDAPTTTRVTVTFKDGEKEIAKLAAAHGTIPPLTNEEIREKASKLFDLVVGGERRDEIEKLVLGIETLADVTALTELLRGTVRAPFE